MKTRILLLIGLMLSFLSGCTLTEVIDRDNLPDDLIVVDSYPVGMKSIQTRSAKMDRELRIQNRTLLIFDSEGNRVSYQTVQGDQGAFVIDRSSEEFQHHASVSGKSRKELLESCTLFILANCNPEELNGCTNLDALLNFKVRATTLHPEQDESFYFPMSGVTNQLNFYYDAQDPKTETPPQIDPVPLQMLYAKIKMKIQVATPENIPGETQEFRLQSWKVLHAPTYALLRQPAAEEETDFVKQNCLDFIVHEPETWGTGNQPISGNEAAEIEFYVLEHKVNPRNHVDKNGHYTQYPAGIRQEEKQRFKPLLCTEDQHPLIVEFEGEYSDHQGHKHHLRYSVYLGENNIDNFHVNRNRCYQNNILIKGSSKSKGEADGNENISVDYRVEIDQSGQDIIVSVERETMLDCHIEVRPMDILIKNVDAQGQTPDGTYVLVDIVDPQTKEPIQTSEYTWARFEKKSSATAAEQQSTHCADGRRKYFTVNLVGDQGLLKTSGTHARIDNNNDNRIWIYFDENPKASVDGMRTMMLRFSYYENNQCLKYEYYKFMQHDMYPVEIRDASGKVIKTYYIEYYEEYLYNLDPKDDYGKTVEGMPWGLSGVLYSETPAIDNITGIANISFIKDAILEAGGYYDYKDNYNGLEYTKKLIRKGDGLHSFEVLPLNQQPRSAAEYCYNKNKRKPDGTVNQDAQTWYLPAIGEIQDITQSEYEKFNVFQDKYYWSSQTTYGNGQWSYQGITSLSYTEGPFFFEDMEYARATKTVKKNGEFIVEGSEVSGIGKIVECHWEIKGSHVVASYPTPTDVIIREPGNQRRSASLRVRAVRK